MRRGRERSYGSVCALGMSRDEKLISLCGAGYKNPITWRLTHETVTCRLCVDRLERLAEQALVDEPAIALLIEAANRRLPADVMRARAVRQAWPTVGRAVADLLRRRGVKLGEGWTR